MSTVRLQVHNVKAYGAVGDGVTDDTASIQAAVNAAAEADSPVYPRAATYKIGNGIAFTQINFPE